MQNRLAPPRWAAKAALALVTLGSLLAAALAANNAAMEARMRRDLAYLASEECEGRGVETQGLNKAAEYIAAQFKEAGLKPGGVDGTYFQPFTMTGAARLQGGKLVLRGPQGQTVTLRPGIDFAVMGFSAAGKLKDLPVVFAGHGVTGPKDGYDDYEGIDAKGKVVIVIRKSPNYDNDKLEDAVALREFAPFNKKLANAELHEAAAMLLVNDAGEVGVDPKTKKARGDDLMPFAELARGLSAGSIPALQVKRAVVDDLLNSATGKGLDKTEAAIARDMQPHSAPLTGWTVSLEADVERKDIAVKNVIGVLEGAGPLADEIVVVGAHYDHLGYGERGSLAGSAEDKRKIHFGADDNASGTTAMMELARRFAGMEGRQGRKLVFMGFSAEEKGLLGSRHYCNKEPLFPLEKTAAMVNLDMVGRMQQDKKTGKGKLIAEGVATAKGFEDLVDELNKEYGFQLAKKAGNSPYSDHASFYGKGVPVLFFWTDTHPDYHRPTDTADKINYEDMVRIVNMAGDAVGHLAGAEKRPEYVKVAPSSPGPTRGNIPTLGIVPGYGEGGDGLAVAEVRVESTAKAGLKAGDRIVGIGSLPVTNIETYMAAMGRQRRGQPIDVTVVRGDKKLTLQITPQ